ncbi:hypothetical protein Ade02nite_86270 [Paractinoplanes deccanensis]|uniref:Uncharacterized protein n=1 Tax=Paractinoplanes deccanensis TaxID=113561 RepID=A0ABQ3YJ13_9ACTN|nr:hypothetical protein Ade02nite_86270 [Actinoplanes deccanensis]
MGVEGAVVERVTAAGQGRANPCVQGCELVQVAVDADPRGGAEAAAALQAQGERAGGRDRAEDGGDRLR